MTDHTRAEELDNKDYEDGLQHFQSLSEDDKKIRSGFALLYVRNGGRAKDACIELGWIPEYAEQWAKIFMEEPFVHRLIKEWEKRREVDDSKEKDVDNRTRYRSWLEKEAQYFGPGSSQTARVAAIKQLMSTEGMDKPKQLEITANQSGVMIVPAHDNWADACKDSQTQLKQTVEREG